MKSSFDDIIWNSLPLPGILIDSDDNIQSLNTAAEIFLNASMKSMVGHPFFERIIVDPWVDSSFERARGGHSALVHHDVLVTTGSRPPERCNMQIAPINDHPDHLMLLLEPKQIAGRLGQAMQVKSAAKSAIGMAEMLSHEIKNPLAGITGAAQLMSMNMTGDDLELADLIVEESRRIVALLEQVEQFGDLRPPELKPVNIHDILERAKMSATVGFGLHMKFEDNYDPSLPLTIGDSDQLLQVFLNLLRNAAEAGKEGGKITLRTFYDQSLRMRRSDGQDRSLPLQVEIIDDGPGIPADIASSAFEPFVSARENGTGLGLALVSKIISEHDGSVVVDSHPGRTVFRISLPAANSRKEKK